CGERRGVARQRAARRRGRDHLGRSRLRRGGRRRRAPGCRVPAPLVSPAHGHRPGRGAGRAAPPGAPRGPRATAAGAAAGRRGGRRGGRASPAPAAPRPSEGARVDTEAGAHTAPHDEVVEVVRELAQRSSNGAVLIDTVARALKERGFSRPPGSPRLITRLRRIRELAVSRAGMITLTRAGAPAPVDDATVDNGSAGDGATDDAVQPPAL